jgi:CheY-like chemotaxis protein
MAEANTAEIVMRALLAREMRRALFNLYDPGVLRRSPLVRLFELDRRRNPAFALQRVLADAIEALRPDESVPSEAGAWRVYRILCDRYVERYTQQEVARDLALSVRQLRRWEKTAQQMLIDYLWAQYNLGKKPHLLAGLPVGEDVDGEIEDLDEDVREDREEERDASAVVVGPTREQEIAWLERGTPSEPADVQDLVQSVLTVVAPLLQAAGAAVDWRPPGNLPLVTVQVTTTRQALIDIITAAVHSLPGCCVDIHADVSSTRERVHLRVAVRSSGSELGYPAEAANLDLARDLLGISGGTIDIVADPDAAVPFAIDVTLPSVERTVVLVIDDNIDTLRLFQSYLSGTRYRFVGTSSPDEALALAVQVAPSVILLDVMLPGIDGWELMGRLREHPRVRGVPIVVCTILAQEQLALALGASGFIHKPVTQAAFLDALDRQV